MMEGYDLFKDLTPAESDTVLALGSRLKLSHGQELFHLGDTANSLFVIERGRLRLTSPMEVLGRRQDILVEERSAGQTVGWSALTPPYRYTLTASAPVDTEVIVFPRETLWQYFAERPVTGYKVSLNLAAVIGQRLQLFQTMWIREIQRTVEVRCA